ncbi:MAG TPA: hypothetical protein VFH73_11620 [Polyangia bacterium]|nr:hypothetical protein [Polyangia bacterium]
MIFARGNPGAASMLPFAIIVFMVAPPARASDDGDSPCRWQDGIARHGTGPLPSGVGSADFGMVPEACPGFDVLARLRGVLLVASDAPDFYGNAGGGLMLRLRRGVSQRTWVSLALDILTYRYVANAVVRSDRFSIGPPTFGLYHRLALPFAGALAVYGRLLLPFDTARDGFEVGGELGLSTWVPLGTRHGLQGGIALPVPVDISGGQLHGAFAPALLAEAFWTPHRAVALFAGAAVRTQAIPDAALRSVAVRAAAQLFFASGLRLALAAEIPLVGDDRTDAIVSLLATWIAAPATPIAR